MYRVLLAVVLAAASIQVRAQCTVSVDYDVNPYALSNNLDGVGMGSIPAERNAAAYTAAGIYRTNNGANSLPTNSTMCVTYDDNATEVFNIKCQVGTACVELKPDTFRAPSNWSGGGSGSGFYRYGGGGWTYNGYVGCVNCIYYGEVGDVRPAPPTSEQ